MPYGSSALPLTLNVWWHDAQQFEVGTFPLSDNGTWCYELYEVNPDAEGNDYIEVQIPDASPNSGPFIPEPADRVTLAVHGDWTIPWPVFRRFINAIQVEW